jgi:diguanylate cyclase (GGDEF)-like protein
MAEDGADGWDRVREDPAIQAVFSDLSMPNVDGFGLLERIRKAEDERINGLPVIIVTSGEGEEIRKRAHDEGATDFITKPFDSVDLAARAKAHVDARRTQTTLSRHNTGDPVTGLHNRDYFLDRLQRDQSLARRHEQPLSVIYLELPGFRELFLKIGRNTSNRVLEHLARLLRGQIRQEDTLARIGLAQFGFCLPMTDASGAEKLAERLLGRVSRTRFTLRNRVLTLSPALGVTTLGGEREIGGDKLLTEMQAMVADAVKVGGNHVVLDARDIA